MDATQPQMKLITDLVVERTLPEDGPFADELDAIKARDFSMPSKAHASVPIKYLFTLDRAKNVVLARKPGVYDVPDVGIVKIRQVRGCKDKTTLLLDRASMRYTDAPELMWKVEPYMRMRAEDTAPFMRASGHCLWCTEVIEPVFRNSLQNVGPRCARKLI